VNLAFFIARRYLFARKSTSAINLISLISIAGIFIGTAALIIILSVFNGFKGIALSMYNSFSPDLKIEATSGKGFVPPARVLTMLKSTPGIASVIQSLEEKALLVYHNRQYIATLKGLDSGYQKLHVLDTMIIDGRMRLEGGNFDYGVLGTGIQYRLGVSIKALEPLEVYSPARHPEHLTGSISDFNRQQLYPEGVFSIQEEYDDRYVLTSLRFMRNLLNEPAQVSSLDIYVDNNSHDPAKITKIGEDIGKLHLGPYSVKDRFQQNELLFKTLNSEKWAVFLILAFVLLIAVFNVMGSLTMLVIEKQKDISILLSMGAQPSTVRRVFLLQGLIISLSGGVFGLAVGGAFCWVQQKFGLIKIGAAKTFVVDSYPVVMTIPDFVFVFCTVLSISLVASFLASNQAAKSQRNLTEELGGSF